MSSPENNIVLSFQCNDRPGIVATVTSFFAEQGYNILESSQFQDPVSKRFFMRTVYEYAPGSADGNDVPAQFEAVASEYGMQWEIKPQAHRIPVLIAVSRWGHCLNMLLNTWKNRNMPIDIVGVVSNHDDLRSLTEWYGVDYHHFPMEKGKKAEQEAQILDVFEKSGAELLVLARYMQILSDEMCRRLSGRAINIHHSFLPGFKGAKPYHQAYDKGVKIIGATAHYVTADLDEGPIIEQSVVRVSHAQEPQELSELGRDIEATVLNRAVKWHAEKRVALNGNKTVVFDR